MYREPLPLPQKRRLSFGTSPKFFRLADAIAKVHEPTPTQLDALERSYNSTGQFLMESEEFRDFTISVHPQGSRAIGTIIRPMRRVTEGFDIDIVLRLRRTALSKYGGEQGPVRLINDLHVVLKRYADRHSLKITKWERCITLEYSDGMCVDITPIIEDERFSFEYGDTHAQVPDRALRLYDPTNPMGLVSSFNAAARVRAAFAGTMTFDMAKSASLEPLPEATEVLNRLLSRLVQLLKLHRNVAFGAATLNGDFSPKSVFLTALAAEAYVLRAPIEHDSPLDLLLDVAETMPLFFERQQLGGGREHWLLPNHTAPGDNLASGMNTSAHQEAFVAWHGRLVADLERILACIESRSGLDRLVALVKEAFGERAAQSVLASEAPQPPTRPGLGRVFVGTAAAASALPMQSRAHTFFGK